MISQQRMVDHFLEMIQIHSPSKGEKEMADYLETYLTQRGFTVKSDNAGAAYGGTGRNLVAYLPGDPGSTPIGFCAHMDQVGPCANIHPVIDGHMIRTDGTTTLGGDDKGGIAAILEAAEDVLETGAPHRDIYLVFTSTEELGMQGAKHIDRSILPALDFVVPDAAESPDYIAYKAPATEDIRVTFFGRKAHAGIEPEKGINAIVAASKAIANMHIGRLDPETTSNIGHIEGGGATNVVTDQVSFTAEIRSHSMERLDAEVAHMEHCCTQAAEEMGASCKFEHELCYPTLSVDPESDLVKRTITAIQSVGVAQPELRIIGGGSDANVLSGYGCHSVIIGLGMRDVHTTDENLDTDELLKAAKILRYMMSV